VLGDRPGADAARAGDHDRAREQLGKHQAADADRRALHPSQRDADGKTRDRSTRERHVGLWQTLAIVSRSQASRNTCCGKSREAVRTNGRGIPTRARG
jgi:hypothetical protein